MSFFLSKAEKVQHSFDRCMLSASGWRKIFVQDGDEYSLSSDICEEDFIFVRLCVRSVASIWIDDVPNPMILIGSDSRPTSSILLKICSDEFLKLSVRLLFCGVLPITQIMSSCQQRDSVHGFFYVSASHNPPGYNGFKFGLSDGKILSGSKNKVLVEVLRRSVLEISSQYFTEETFSDCLRSAKAFDLDSLENVKDKTLQDYENFLCHIAESPQRVDGIFSEIRKIMLYDPLGIVIDFNGSSRILSCDCHYLSLFGIQTVVVGDILGQFDHDIVPEGKSLSLCQQVLEYQHGNDSSYKLGYVPDCDGDRGNLVVYDIVQNKAIPLEAQDVFCLCVLSELSYLKSLNPDLSHVAVVVNDATSLRINYVCLVFGVHLFVVETGEANVVQKADELRRQGFLVRCYGEGSNGGSIVYPSGGRDPLNMLTSIVKLLYLRGTKCGLAQIWARIAGVSFSQNWDLMSLLRTFPKYQTTNVFEDAALVKSIHDQAKTKENYGKIFQYLWPFVKNKMKDILSIVSYYFISYEGVEEICGEISSGSGGLRVIFYQSQGDAVCFFWMRSSKTEPVMRILVDVRHDDEAIYQCLYRYHCGILRHASNSDKVDPQYENLRHLLIPVIG